MSNSSLSSLPLTALDFDTLKQNFLNYLTSQSVFRDYNFTGSNMNVLLDIMSYNTYLNAFYLNMIGSEMFLDSAQKMDSVVSHAKELNYLPRSAQSSEATISFTVYNPSQISPLIIPQGTAFSGINANGSYTFITNESTSYLSPNATYNVANLQIFEGSYLTDTFVMDYSNNIQQFVLSNPSIDISSLVVTVIENGVNTYFTQETTLYNLTSSSNVYFIQAAQAGQYEILFGDNLFGRIPINLAIIVASYRICNGTDADGVYNFQSDSNLFISGPITTVANSSSSANAETIDSVRFTAPRYFAAQQRAVSSDDYESLILANYGSQIADVAAYGGELLTPKQYGTVAVCLRPTTGIVAPNYLKNEILNFLNNDIAVPGKAIITDPDYIYIGVDSTVTYDISKTQYTSAQIQTIILDAIQSFSANSLGDFNTNFYFSRFAAAIDNADISIVNNDTEISLIKRITPQLNYPTSYTLNFNNSAEIEPTNSAIGYIGNVAFYDEPTLTSSLFSYMDSNGVTWPYSYIRDNNLGTLVIYTTVNNKFIILNDNIGTITYNNGLVTLNNFTVQNYKNYIELYMNPQINDIVVENNIVAIIDLNDVSVTINTIS